MQVNIKPKSDPPRSNLTSPKKLRDPKWATGPDCPVAERLIRRPKPPKRMLGDKAYDSAELREELDQRGTKPIIPNRSNRKQPYSFSKRLYKLRWRIESAFNRLKYFRRIATR
jgi:transposase